MRELIRQALVYLSRAAEGNSRLSDHMAALVRTPSYGSFVRGLDTWHDTGHFLLDLDWAEINHDDLPPGTGLPFCRYFQANVPEDVEAIENIATYTEAIQQSLNVQVVEGHKLSPETGNPRGLRLVATSTDHHLAHVIYLILGPTEMDKDPNLIPWTWHPGRIVAPLAGKAVEAAERLLKGEALTEEEAEALGQCGVHLGDD